MEYRSARQMAKEFKKYGGFSWCGGPLKCVPTNAKQRRMWKRKYGDNFKRVEITSLSGL
jgi:hypothetical protein